MSKPNSESGFVLPYVLATIAILSLIAVLGANTLRDAQMNVRKLQTHKDLARALDDAEAVVTDAFLTATVVPKGLYMGQRAARWDIDIDLGAAEGENKLTEDMIWPANGGGRLVDVDGVNVGVEYQDATGLVSLYTANPELIVSLVRDLGVRSNIAEQLVAKLGDYTDVDDQRRFTGGERADYRMANRNPPTNSPIRNYDELSAVLEWGEQPFYMDRTFLKYITFFNTGSTPRVNAMPGQMAKLVKDSQRRAREVEDPLTDATNATAPLPSSRARFTFTAAAPGNAYGLRRVIETERSARAPDFAVSRRLIAEYMLPAKELESLNLNGLPALPLSTLGRADR